jgi:hypothetical protein
VRRLAALVVALGAGALVLAPGTPDPVPVEEYRTVDGSLLACPVVSITEDSAGLLTGLVVPPASLPAPEPTALDGPTAAPEEGTAALRRIDADLDLARITGPDLPVSLEAVDRSLPTVVMVAGESFAPTAVAGVASHERGGTGAGLASAACPEPSPEWWFVGAGSQLGRGAALLVSNPAQEPARFDLRLFARSGPVAALAGKGINLGPQSRVRLRLDALAQGEELLALQVRATSGRVAAALRDVSVPRGEQPRGVDFIPPTLAPTTQLWIAGVPGGPGSRDLVLVNPGEQFATLQVRLLTEQGPQEVPGLTTIAVPAGSVITTSLDRVLSGRSGTLALTSDVPVTGGVRADWGRERRDMSWLSATPGVGFPNPLAAAAVVPAGAGLSTTVTVAAPGAAVDGTLQVWVTGASAESVFTAEGPLDAGDPAGDADGDPVGPRVVTGVVGVEPSIRVSVPAGSQREVVVPGLDDAAIAHLAWTSGAGSGPALLSHVTVDAERPAATGFSWWPTRSAVAIQPVREDIGTLLPAG